jgi:transcriptional regulator with GAF, ATPase, and Fis domain
VRISKTTMSMFGDTPHIGRTGCGTAAVGQFADRRPSSERHVDPLQSTVAELAGAVVSGASIEEVLRKLTSTSLTLVPGADYAQISIVDNGALLSLAATSQLTAVLESAQQAARQGPCFEAVTARRTIRCDDLSTDSRWPRLTRLANATGVRSVLSSPLDIAGDTGATLDLFGRRPGAFAAGTETVVAVLASHAAIAVVRDKQDRQFRAALASRDIIGQAKGIVMERFGVDATRAFEMLVAISQDTNTPVRDLAAKVVDTASQ